MATPYRWPRVFALIFKAFRLRFCILGLGLISWECQPSGSRITSSGLPPDPVAWLDSLMRNDSLAGCRLQRWVGVGGRYDTLLLPSSTSWHKEFQIVMDLARDIAQHVDVHYLETLDEAGVQKTVWEIGNEESHSHSGRVELLRTDGKISFKAERLSSDLLFESRLECFCTTRVLPPISLACKTELNQESRWPHRRQSVVFWHRVLRP